MRCLAIAEEIYKLGEDVTFITADRQAIELISEYGFEIVCLDSDWNNLEPELDKLIPIIKEYKVEKLLIDSYYVTERYLSQLRKYVKLIYLDDLGKYPYPVDILINYNNYADTLGYEKWAIKNNTTFLLGCSYAPLREEFRDIQRNLTKDIRNILLTTGGSDSYHVALKFISYISKEWCKEMGNSGENDLMNIKHQLKDLTFHVILGKCHPDKKELIKIADKYPNIVLHMMVNNMSHLMRQTDIAITAGGSTMYELCASGVPMITYSFADNQILGVCGFERMGVSKYCGDIRTDEVEVWEKIIKTIVQYRDYGEVYSSSAIENQKLVDGYGACRLAKRLL